MMPQMRQRRPIPLTPEMVAAIPITERDRDEWEVMALAKPASIEAVLVGTQWSVVFATLRAGMALTDEPGILRLAHDALYSQIVKQKETGD